MPERSSSCGSCTITLALALLGWSTLLQWNQTRLHMDEESLYYALPGVEESDASFVLLVSHFQAELKHVYEPRLSSGLSSTPAITCMHASCEKTMANSLPPTH